MTMQFLSVLKANINSQMPDNSVGAITPAIMRANLQDIVDSLYYRSAALIGDHAAVPIAQALTTTPTNYPNLYTNLIEVDPAVVTGDIVTGETEPLLTGFVNEILMAFTASGANGRIVTARLAKNGTVQDRFTFGVTMTGPGELQAGSIALPTIGVNANDVFTLLLSVDVNASITFSSISLVNRIIPTFSPL